MSVLTVGQNQQYMTLSAALAGSHDGDTINVKAGTYVDDFATVTTNVTIQGVGGLAIFEQSATGVIPNGKAILTTDANVTIDHLAFENAHVPVATGNNGAGIRDETGNLVVTNSLFTGNQDGILGGTAGYTMTVTNSEFSYNGAGDGYSHNIYIGAVNSADLENNYFHNAIVGHEIKSRALSTTIKNNRIFAGPGGTNSYSIDLPNGGVAVIEGNTIEKGPASQNPIFIHYGGEPIAPPGQSPYPISSLTIMGNTFLNDEGGSALLLANQTPNTQPVGATPVVPTVTGNSFYNLTMAQIASGPATVSGNVTLAAEPVLSAASPITPVACFVAGTRIATPDGPRVVERLAEGDLVTTVSGAVRAIVWAGHRRIDCDTYMRPAAVRPIRVEAHAFGDGLPERHLFLSPDHALFAEGVLIPVKHLVNGTTVRQVARRIVAYHHIELERHDVVLAEGLPAETFLDTTGFNAAGGQRDLLSSILWRADRDATVWETAGYAPLTVAGPAIERVRASLQARTDAPRTRRAA